jgi:hypothetical protein
MKNRFALASPFLLAPLGLVALGVLGSQASACNGSLDQESADAGSDADAATVGSDVSDLPPIPNADAAVVNCQVNKGEDYISFCVQKQVLLAEHKVFDPKLGLASSWNVTTGTPDSDGGVVGHDVRDDVAYAATLSIYAISAEVYGDTDIANSVVRPDLAALAPLVEAELATLPASYDGELYMRLRRFANGMRLMDDVTNGAALDAIAQAYGQAIYTTYFHPIASGASVSPPRPQMRGVAPTRATMAGLLAMQETREQMRPLLRSSSTTGYSAFPPLRRSRRPRSSTTSTRRLRVPSRWSTSPAVTRAQMQAHSPSHTLMPPLPC